ncbi:bacteriocin secretion accessory protein [Leuconostoc suionicum]|uniref:bacteriocin secretion accessory protein n=1 Tax=Leuconostoc suionicum TaxID=1511761 RepID=UPI00233F6734|nr:bacteriocin secretion accessory protein [Leuconostoc suionicum]MDC2806890.1 bacteriocin secretion accessory protein [Leuconostoc suionicum]MDC2824402.1 bacteriocin secretion accessory protein [Leuconostoc suionicum]
MFDPNYLESGEFYQRRYNNFSTLIIMPIFILVIFVILFGLFAKREIVVKASGEIEPTKVLSDIQSTSNNAIDSNYLSENKLVKKGDTLVTFESNNEQVSSKLLKNQITNATACLKSMTLYKQSINQGSSAFKESDEFGYDSLFNDYIAQIDSLNDEFNQQNSDKQTADSQAEHQIDVLKQGQTKNTQQISECQDILKSIKTGAKVSNNPYQYVYDNYVAQLANAQTAAEKEQIKQAVISNVQQQIDQLTTANTSYDGQIASVTKNGPLSKSSTLDKINDLKQQQLANIQKKINDQQQSLNELTAKDSSVNKEYRDTVIKASETGILHLASDKTNSKYLPKGTIIAQIYPKLTKKTSLQVKYYIPVNNILGLKTSQKIKFTVNQNVTKPLSVTGKVTKISSAPVSLSKEGSFYMCTAKIVVPEKQVDQVKYGLQGNIVITKGTKSWFNYYKDILLGNKN